MIYTVTLNPCLDHTIWTDGLRLGEVNRTTREALYPGGKGVNVSIVLQRLGLENTALGFCAGFTGTALENMLRESGCTTDLIRIGGFTRINTKIKDQKETDINGQGPEIPHNALNVLFQKLDALERGDVLVLAGSIPNTMPADVYERIMARLDGRGIRIVVDATGDLLANVLQYHPFLIKPNQFELGELFGKTLRTQEEIVAHARLLQTRGARNVLVSLGKHGAVLVTENGEVFASVPPDGEVVNAVGAGDSMVAGFLYGYLSSGSYAQALLLGLCAGSATSFCAWLAEGADIRRLAESFVLQKPVGFE